MICGQYYSRLYTYLIPGRNQGYIAAKKYLDHELGELIYPMREGFPTTGGAQFVDI